MSCDLNARIILWVEIISFVLQYTLGLSRDYASVFDLCTMLISLLLLFPLSFRSKEERWKIKIIRWIILIVVISSIINLDTFGLGSIMTIGRFLIYSLLITKFNITKKCKTALLFVFLLQAFVLPFTDLTAYNTNTVGLVFMTLGVYITLLVNPQKKITWIILTLFVAYIEYQIWLSDSRTCMVAFLLFYIGQFIAKPFFKNRLILLTIMLFMTVGSLVYVRTYVYLWEENLVATEIVQGSLESTGKQIFSGRQNIWQEALGLLDEKPLIGTGSKITLKSFFIVNLHNSMLNFFVIYGYLVGLLVIYLIIRIVMDLHDYMEDKEITNCVVAYISFLLVAFSETNLFVLSFMSVLCLMMAYSKKKYIEINNRYTYEI